jgi:hypothetical protein
MGYLTTITIHNDALGDFEKDPEKFAKAIFEGIRRADEENSSVTMGFGGYCNYITVHPPKHADDNHIYVHFGNGVEQISGYSTDWKKLCESHPNHSESLINVVESHLKQMKRTFKRIKS